MNIKIADRLVELRKKNGYSQEQLAEKLGLSRQAVSKWERAEASPDTDNLICLAKLYNVSLDDLLKSDESVEQIASETKEREENESIIINDQGVHIKSKDGKEIHVSSDKEDDDDEEEEIKPNKKQELISGILVGSSLLCCVIAYILLGTFVTNGYALFWPLFLICASLPSIYDCIYKKKITAFLYPVFITGVYCFLGMFCNLWHPFWFLFITIPLFYIIFTPIEKYIK